MHVNVTAKILKSKWNIFYIVINKLFLIAYEKVFKICFFFHENVNEGSLAIEQ